MRTGLSRTIAGLAVGLATCAPLASSPAQTTTLDFTAVPAPAPPLTATTVGASYATQGYTFGCIDASTGMPCATLAVIQAGPSYPGQPVLFNNNIYGITTLSRTDGGLFDLFSAAMSPFSSIGGNIVFEGTVAGGGTVTQSFPLGNTPTSLSTALFSGFMNLSSIRFAVAGFTGGGAANAVQITDIVVGPSASVTVTPEPTSAVLFVTGLIGLVSTARRRRTPR